MDPKISVIMRFQHIYYTLLYRTLQCWFYNFCTEHCSVGSTIFISNSNYYWTHSNSNYYWTHSYVYSL